MKNLMLTGREKQIVRCAQVTITNRMNNYFQFSFGQNGLIRENDGRHSEIRKKKTRADYCPNYVGVSYSQRQCNVPISLSAHNELINLLFFTRKIDIQFRFLSNIANNESVDLLLAKNVD